MNELRWILIVFGIALLGGIYFWGRRKAAAQEVDEAPHTLREPPLAGRDPRVPQEPVYEPVQYEPAAYADDEAYAADRYDTDVSAPDAAEEDNWQSASDHQHPSTHEPRRQMHDLSHDDSAAVPADDVPDYRRARREPTLGDIPASPPQPRTAASRQSQTQPQSAPAAAARETVQPARRAERRKILALRLSLAPQSAEGGRLLEVFQEELLEHGHYSIFHRLHEDGETIFSIASMIEPGTFDPEQMGEEVYPGVTLFAQLPGPVAGMNALNEMVSCARRMQHALGGVLQDDRGVTLTEHRVEHMREEVREFERPQGGRPGPGMPH